MAAREPSGSHQETVTADALEGTGADPVAALVEMHRRVAARLLSEGAPSKAFGELVRASRAVPMTRRLAAHLVAFSLRASTEPAAVTLLQTGIDDTEGEERAAIRRQLARLFRRLKATDRAREVLNAVLAESPGDRRARLVLHSLLESEGQWNELDASLEKESKEALKRGQLRRASRATLQRARVCERLGDKPRAALRYGQAAQYLEQAGEHYGAFDLRILWLRALRSAQGPKRALEDAEKIFLSSGEAAGQLSRARTLLAAWKGRTETQRELMLAAEVADASGRAPEAAALFHAALDEGPDPTTQRRIEARFIARRAWRELAQFYRDRAARAAKPAQKIEQLTRLAELLEDELQDAEGAARAYEEIVRLNGDPAALKEQVRLLSAKKDQSGVRRAFDTAVDGARSSDARVQALIARGEAFLRKKDWTRARKDFEAALALDASDLNALAGKAEASARVGDLKPITALRVALRKAPRRTPHRSQLLRRLARLSTAPLGDVATARWAWLEVLAESPDDAEVQQRLIDLALHSKDDALLERVLAAAIECEPRGPQTRLSRIERVQALERLGRNDDAFFALRDAVRFEPGHKEAWLMLAERCAARGANGEAAWAWEQAATSTEDEAERAEIWLQLARFVKDVLGDAQRVQVFERRGRKLQLETSGVQRSPPMIAAPPQAAPEEERAKTEGSGTDPSGTDPSGTNPNAEAPPELLEAQAPPELREPEGPPELRDDEALRAETELEMPALELPSSPNDWRDSDDERSGAALEAIEEIDAEDVLEVDAVLADVLEITTGDIMQPEIEHPPPPVEDWEAPPGQMDDGPSTVELPVPVPLGEAGVPATPSLPTPAVQKLRNQRAKLVERVRESPLEAEGYHQLAEYFDHVGDADRSALMAEIGHALEGDPHAAPLPPKLILSAMDRAGLRHPALRGEEGELLALSGVALCRAYPERARGPLVREEFRLDAGRGAQAAAEALLAAVRILGVRAPDVFVSEDNGPPFSLSYGSQGPRLLVGRLAVKKPLPEAELRFFAGRALFTMNPDLLALRTLKKDQLARGVGILPSVIRGGRQLSGEGRAMREGLSPKALPRLQQLLGSVGRDLHWPPLTEGARHSANRAGLVVSGGVAPALLALRAKKALPAEMIELIRFAASERYLQLRLRRLR